MVPTHLLYFAPHRHDNSHLLHFHSTDTVFFSSLLPVLGKSRPPSPFPSLPYLSIHNSCRILTMNIFTCYLLAFVPPPTTIHRYCNSPTISFHLRPIELSFRDAYSFISLGIILLSSLRSRCLWSRISPFVTLLFSPLYLDLQHNGQILVRAWRMREGAASLSHGDRSGTSTH